MNPNTEHLERELEAEEIQQRGDELARMMGVVQLREALIREASKEARAEIGEMKAQCEPRRLPNQFDVVPGRAGLGRFQPVLANRPLDTVSRFQVEIGWPAKPPIPAAEKLVVAL